MSKTQHHQTSLSAAFNMSNNAALVKKNNNNNINNQESSSTKFVRHNSSQSDCDNYYYQDQDQEQEQEHQQQYTDNRSFASSTSSCQQQQVSSNNNTNMLFTQVIQGPTFIPVFNSVKDILPHHNAPAKGQVPWSCSNCNNSRAFGHKCQTCHKSRDISALRVFMGQLTKEGDVQLIIKMLEVLCPEIDQATSLLHIEPHTHANTGRGKGCAWVYVSTFDQVLYIVGRLHKRTYPTVNAETGEVGFVAFPDSYTNEQIKDAFDNDVTFLSESVIPLFHRSPITAEVPLSLQRSLPQQQGNNNNANATTTARRQQQQQQQQTHRQQFNNNNMNNNNRVITTTPTVPMMMPQQQQNVSVTVGQQQPRSTTNTVANNNTNMKVVAYNGPSSSSSSSNKAVMMQQQQQHQQVQQQQENNTNENNNNANNNNNNNNFKRYRWNPYAVANARVSVRN